MRNYDRLFLDEIVEITEENEEYTIDISVDGNNLFIANNILTHNSGYSNSEIDITNTSESIGTASTLDFFIAIVVSEELEAMGQIMIKQLKNRWGDLNYYKKFVVGIDRSKMKLFNLEETATNNLQTEAKNNYEKKPTSKKKFFDTGEVK